jgi:hypothetical protein
MKTSRAEKENGLAKGRKVEATNHPAVEPVAQNRKESELRCWRLTSGSHTSLINRRLSAPSPALCRDFYQTNRGFDRM